MLTIFWLCKCHSELSHAVNYDYFPFILNYYVFPEANIWLVYGLFASFLFLLLIQPKLCQLSTALLKIIRCFSYFLFHPPTESLRNGYPLEFALCLVHSFYPGSSYLGSPKVFSDCSHCLFAYCSVFLRKCQQERMFEDLPQKTRILY